MPAMPMTYNLIQLKAWAEQSGIRFWTTPQAKNTVEGYGGRGSCLRCNTCEICPTGARYSPDWTFKQSPGREEDPAPRPDARPQARAGREDDPHCRVPRLRREDGTDNDVEYRARTFVLASGYCWSPHLLLLSANPAVPERPRELVRSRRPVHDRPSGVSDDDRSEREDLSGDERAAQPDLAAVLPVPDRPAVRASRPATCGRTPAAAGRSCATRPASCCSATR